MLELCRLILVLTTFLEKLNFTWGILGSGGKLWSGTGSCSLCPIGNYAPGHNPLPLSGWRSVGMWFWNHSKLYIKRRITYCYTYLFKLFTWQFHRNTLSIRKIVHPKRKKDKWKQFCRRIQVILPKIFEMKTNLVCNTIYRTYTRNDLFWSFHSFLINEWLFI